MTITTVEFKDVRTPDVLITFDDSLPNNQTSIVCRFIGLAPIRTVSGAELLSGIVSLNPPTVHGETVDGLLNLMISACSTAVGETPGVELTPTALATLVTSVSYGVNSAIGLFEDAL